MGNIGSLLNFLESDFRPEARAESKVQRLLRSCPVGLQVHAEHRFCLFPQAPVVGPNLGRPPSLPVDFVSRVELSSVKLDKGKFQEATGRSYLGTEEA